MILLQRWCFYLPLLFSLKSTERYLLKGKWWVRVPGDPGTWPGGISEGLPGEVTPSNFGKYHCGVGSTV